MLAILLPPAALRVPVTFAAVLVALALTGALSARLGGSNVRRAVMRAPRLGQPSRRSARSQAKSLNNTSN